VRIAFAASWVHKWIALVVCIQVLLWMASGLFFAVYPIERVRSEHRVAPPRLEALNAAASLSPKDVAVLLPRAPTRLSYERDARGRAVVIAEFAEGRPALVDVAENRLASPLTEAAAREIAQAAIQDPPPVSAARLVESESAEYRGALPAWRVTFRDPEGLVVYVAADTGRITARRSDLWRLYDALWALHIMDWRDHENFNNGLLIVAAALSLLVVITGIVLFPFRLGWPRKRAN